MQVRRKVSWFATVAAAVAPLVAGGFALEIGKPAANPEARAKNAALVVRGYACVDQEKTTIAGEAEGVVNGKRESVALKLIPLSGQGRYAVAKQWPSEGKWVLKFVMTNPHFGQQSAMVRVDGDAVDWAGVTRLGHAPTNEDVEAALGVNTVASRRE